ncbi:sialate O-acetylesterase [Sphingobacterium sp. SGG-5]|uniref:sialate O-acetylesterase n=1 Tax=Sphingobacterium sp. SGG-5 TaxID=2710881 RepID=UPI0013EA1967|nr:sialate O-acetylesterase [Sphingobacterium sp. SGG-5]NGM61217.1 sialate O-acetylesterase [Sphingobacterium sp. SGG-5]
MLILKKYLLLLLVNLIISNAFAKISLPSIFSDNMVLQQNSTVSIWGKAKVNVKVTVRTSWNNQNYTTMSDSNGSWKLSVVSTKAGGPYQVKISDGEEITLNNVLLGEVWVCSGQSNMEMPVKGFRNQPTLNAADILLDADNSHIRLIKYDKELSRTLRYDGKSTSWQVSDAQSAREFSAVGYQFAQELQRKLKVPIGMIMSTWGGTKVEAWMPENALRSFSGVKVSNPADTAKITKNDPSVLYNAMINPFLGYGIQGVLWYQGEANRSNYEQYDELMETMVKSWRKAWNIGEWPFYYVQIAPFKYDGTHESAFLREAQSNASTQISNAGMVVSMDVGAKNYIHPPDKTVISKRLLYWALANVYGMKGLAFASPAYKSHKIDNDRVTIFFSHAENGLTSFGKSLKAFEIAGEDKVFHPAEAKITAKGVVVHSKDVKNPIAVRYAFKDWVVGDLFNTEGLPASSFRTDHWSFKGRD